VSLGRNDRLSDEALDAFDAVVVVERAATIDQELLERLDARAQRGLPVVRVGRPLLPGDSAALARLARTLDATDRAAVAGTLVRDSPQRTRVSLPDDDDDGDGVTRPRAAWLVVSEGWSLHDGWRITTESDPPRELTSFRADGVVSALLLQPGERAVRARYAPSEARAGAALGGAGLALVLALLLWPARRWPQGARPPGPSR
jgi:hypothetical protein